MCKRNWTHRHIITSSSSPLFHQRSLPPSSTAFDVSISSASLAYSTRIPRLVNVWTWLCTSLPKDILHVLDTPQQSWTPCTTSEDTIKNRTHRTQIQRPSFDTVPASPLYFHLDDLFITTSLTCWLSSTCLANRKLAGLKRNWLRLRSAVGA